MRIIRDLEFDMVLINVVKNMRDIRVSTVYEKNYKNK
jgi:hypothetical protein